MQEVLFFVVGSATVLISLITGYFLGKANTPEQIVESVKQIISRPSGSVIQEPDPDEEQRLLKEQFDEDKRKNPFAKPPEGLDPKYYD